MVAGTFRPRFPGDGVPDVPPRDHCPRSAHEANVRSPFYKTEAQRSGFGFGSRSDEVTELSRPRGSEGYAVRGDSESEGFIFGKHKNKSLRRPSGAAGGN